MEFLVAAAAGERAGHAAAAPRQQQEEEEQPPTKKQKTTILGTKTSEKKKKATTMVVVLKFPEHNDESFTFDVDTVNSNSNIFIRILNEDTTSLTRLKKKKGSKDGENLASIIWNVGLENHPMEHFRMLFDIIQYDGDDLLQSTLEKGNVCNILRVAIDYGQYSAIEVCERFLTSNGGEPSMEEYQNIVKGTYVWDIMDVLSMSYDNVDVRLHLSYATKKFFQRFANFLSTVDVGGRNVFSELSLNVDTALNVPLKRKLKTYILPQHWQVSSTNQTP